MHHAERERAVGAGQQRDVLGAFLGRKAAIGIDRDHLGAAPLRRLHARPQVQVRHHRVRAPQDDEARLVEALGVHADRAAERGLQPILAGARAQRAIEQRRAELVEEAPVHRAVLHHAHRAGIAARQNGLGVFRGQALQPRGDLIECGVPADAFELSFAFPADALHRVAQAIGRVGALQVMADLGAERAVGERRLRITLDLGRHTLVDRDEHGAGIGTIVRARSSYHFADGFAHAFILRR